MGKKKFVVVDNEKQELFKKISGKKEDALLMLENEIKENGVTFTEYYFTYNDPDAESFGLETFYAKVKKEGENQSTVVQGFARTTERVIKQHAKPTLADNSSGVDDDYSKSSQANYFFDCEESKVSIFQNTEIIKGELTTVQFNTKNDGGMIGTSLNTEKFKKLFVDGEEINGARNFDNSYRTLMGIKSDAIKSTGSFSHLMKSNNNSDTNIYVVTVAHNIGTKEREFSLYKDDDNFVALRLHEKKTDGKSKIDVAVLIITSVMENGKLVFDENNKFLCNDALILNTSFFKNCISIKNSRNEEISNPCTLIGKTKSGEVTKSITSTGRFLDYGGATTFDSGRYVEFEMNKEVVKGFSGGIIIDRKSNYVAMFLGSVNDSNLRGKLLQDMLLSNYQTI